MSAAGISRALKKEQVVEYRDLSEKQTSRRMLQTRNRLFGKPTSGNEGTKTKGLIGSCRLVWAIKVDDYNTYRYMTEAEEKIFHDLLLASSTVYPGYSFAELSLYAEAYQKGELTKEEFDSHFEPEKIVNDFKNAVVFPFKARTGLMLVRATQHKIENEDKRKEALALIATIE